MHTASGVQGETDRLSMVLFARLRALRRLRQNAEIDGDPRGSRSAIVMPTWRRALIRRRCVAVSTLAPRYVASDAVVVPIGRRCFARGSLPSAGAAALPEAPSSEAVPGRRPLGSAAMVIQVDGSGPDALRGYRCGLDETSSPRSSRPQVGATVSAGVQRAPQSDQAQVRGGRGNDQRRLRDRDGERRSRTADESGRPVATAVSNAWDAPYGYASSDLGEEGGRGRYGGPGS